jgi:hypothetical protein
VGFALTESAAGVGVTVGVGVGVAELVAEILAIAACPF